MAARLHDATMAPCNITSTDTTGSAAVICRAADQPEAGGVRFALTAELTNGPLDVGIERVAQGTGPPMHIHHNMDEYVVVLSGSLHCRLGDRDVDLKTGDAAFMPRGLEHTFTNLHAEPCDCFWVFNPGGFSSAELGPRAAQSVAAQKSRRSASSTSGSDGSVRPNVCSSATRSSAASRSARRSRCPSRRCSVSSGCRRLR